MAKGHTLRRQAIRAKRLALRQNNTSQDVIVEKKPKRVIKKTEEKIFKEPVKKKLKKSKK